MNMITLSAATLCLGLTLGNAHAGEANDAAALNIRFADLDLARSIDAATLYRRIQNAARQVCSTQPGNVDACTQRAVSQAVKAIDNPMLTNQHLVRSHAPESRAEIAVQ
jgi:UrcA family protein